MEMRGNCSNTFETKVKKKVKIKGKKKTKVCQKIKSIEKIRNQKNQQIPASPYVKF